MSDPETESLAMRLISGCITEVIDPKLYYSRFSFLESGKEAIDIKYQMTKKAALTQGNNADPTSSPFFPNVKNKYYTRSTLVKNLFPMPSEGKVRAMFIEPPITGTKLPNITRRSHTLAPNSVEKRGSVSRSPFVGDTTADTSTYLKPNESKLKVYQ